MVGNWEIINNDTPQQKPWTSMLFLLFSFVANHRVVGFIIIIIVDISLAASKSECEAESKIIRISTPVFSPQYPPNPRAPTQSFVYSTRLVLALLWALDLGDTAELLGAVLPLLAWTGC